MRACEGRKGSNDRIVHEKVREATLKAEALQLRDGTLEAGAVTTKRCTQEMLVDGPAGGKSRRQSWIMGMW